MQIITSTVPQPPVNLDPLIDALQVDTLDSSRLLQINHFHPNSGRIPRTRHSAVQSTGLTLSMTSLKAARVHKVSSPCLCFPVGLQAGISEGITIPQNNENHKNTTFKHNLAKDKQTSNPKHKKHRKSYQVTPQPSDYTSSSQKTHSPHCRPTTRPVKMRPMAPAGL